MVRLPQKGAERANQATKGVPMGRIPWETSASGHFEVDLVYHSGESTAGQYGHTIQLVDVATGWSERVAVMGRGQAAMEGGFRHILARVPFALLELHPDSGSEFFNQHLVRFWKDKVTGVQLSRSRPSHKNDNRLVEQKNDTLVRQYVGQLRLDTASPGASAGRALRADVGLLQSVSTRPAPQSETAQWRQGEAEVGSGADALRARPGERRLVPEQQARLQQLYEQTNPLALRQEIYRRLADLWDMPSAAAGTAA